MAIKAVVVRWGMERELLGEVQARGEIYRHKWSEVRMRIKTPNGCQEWMSDCELWTSEVMRREAWWREAFHSIFHRWSWCRCRVTWQSGAMATHLAHHTLQAMSKLRGSHYSTTVRSKDAASPSLETEPYDTLCWYGFVPLAIVMTYFKAQCESDAFRVIKILTRRPRKRLDWSFWKLVKSRVDMENLKETQPGCLTTQVNNPNQPDNIQYELLVDHVDLQLVSTYCIHSQVQCFIISTVRASLMNSLTTSNKYSSKLIVTRHWITSWSLKTKSACLIHLEDCRERQ